MSRYVPAVLREKVAELSAFRCEYCRYPESESFLKFHVDHIISLKHGGATKLNNLAFCCPICNSKKGSDLGTILDDEDMLIRIFHPRKQDWFAHFSVSNDGHINPLTDIGRSTIKLLDLNEDDRVLERLDLIKTGRFP